MMGSHRPQQSTYINDTTGASTSNSNTTSTANPRTPGNAIRVENKTNREIKAVLFDHDTNLEWYPLGASVTDNIPGIFSFPKESCVKIQSSGYGDLMLPFGVEKAKLKIFYPETIDVPTQSAGQVSAGQTVQFTGSDFVSADNETLIGAAGVGAIAGFVLLGPITAVALGGIAAYQATQKTEIGALTQSVGKSAKVLTNSAVDLGSQAVEMGIQAKDAVLGPNSTS